MTADQMDKAAAEEEAATASVGQRLRAAREAAGRTVDEIAHELHLDRTVIIALESDDFEILGAAVFIKGYLRSYARLLGLPENDIADALAVSEPEPEEFRTLSARTELKTGANLVNFVLWVALALAALICAAYLLLPDDEPLVEEIDKGEFVLPEVVAPEPEPRADELQAVPEPIAEPEAEPQPVEPEPVMVQLGLSFSEECWVEVSDARKRLIYGLEKPGTSTLVEGVPPFKLFLGNINAVDLRVNDEVYNVPGRRSGRKTARFVIEAEDLPGAGN